MSIEVMAHVYKLAVDPETRDILMALADHADPQGRGVRPSIARIAWKVGDGTRNKHGEYKNHRTVQRRIKELLKIRALILVRKAAAHRANEYILDLSVFPVKEDFVATGDTYHDTPARGDNLSGDKKPIRGDKGVSPEPSSLNNSNKHNPLSESWQEQIQAVVFGIDGQTFMDLRAAWDEKPDERRHLEAMRQMTAGKQMSARTYLKAYKNYNPDYKPPVPDSKNNFVARPPTRPGTSWENLKRYE